LFVEAALYFVSWVPICCFDQIIYRVLLYEICYGLQ